MAIYYSKSTGGFYNNTINTEIPDDAIEITDGQHQALLDGQASGKEITTDAKGKPVNTDRPGPTEYELAETERVKRDTLIAGTDYLLMSDYPITSDKLAQVKTYRQLLRDITKQDGFPIMIDWPEMPE